MASETVARRLLAICRVRITSRNPGLRQRVGDFLAEGCTPGSFRKSGKERGYGSGVCKSGKERSYGMAFFDARAEKWGERGLNRARFLLVRSVALKLILSRGKCDGPPRLLAAGCVRGRA